MIAVAAVLVIVGIIALVYGGFQKHKSGRLASTPFVKTGDAATKGASVAGEKGAISVQGAVETPAPLHAPASGTPCLYYELKVIGSWKEGDQKRSKEYVVERMAAPFTLNDGTGPVAISAEKGGDFDLTQSFRETRKESVFADLKNAVGNREPIVFGHYAFANPPMSQANTFECVEKIVPIAPQLYACGKLDGQVITSPGWSSLILSPKSREELMAGAATHAQYALIGGGAAAGLGALVGVAAQFM